MANRIYQRVAALSLNASFDIVALTSSNSLELVKVVLIRGRVRKVLAAKRNW